MFSLPVFSVDSYDSWRNPRRRVPRVHEQIKEAHQRKPASSDLSSYMAPPLSAYLPSEPGACMFDTQYNNAKQEGYSLHLLTPPASRKLERLRSIGCVGYDTIAPIGIDKTMAQIDYEARELEDDDSNLVQVENLASHMSPSALHEDSEQNQDLDAQVLDADAAADNSAEILSDDDHDFNSLDDMRNDAQPFAISTGTAATSAGVHYAHECGSDVDMVLEDSI